MPKIRHLAIICTDPAELARYYCEVFEMAVVERNERGNVFLSDGYMNVALLRNKAEGKPNGLNHFGFKVEDSAVIAERMARWDPTGPGLKPEQRTFAELRTIDPEGNNFDVSVAGFEREADGMEKREPTPEPTAA